MKLMIGNIMLLLFRTIPSSFCLTCNSRVLASNILHRYNIKPRRFGVAVRGGGSSSSRGSSTIDLEIKDVANESKNISSSLTLSNFGSVPYICTDFIFPKHRVVFVLGGPGAGKGTQSERIVSEYKFCHLSVGELLREEGPKSEHAELIESCLVSGKIVPVEISLSLVRKAMDRESGLSSRYGSKIFLVDGFPRNFDNLKGWSRTMPPFTTLLGALVFDCPENVLEERILKRGETSGRSDDNVESARKRFHTYETQTKPVVRCLEQMQTEDGLVQVHHIVGDKSIEEVWEQVKDILNTFIKNDILTLSEKLLRTIESRDHTVYQEFCHPLMIFGDNDEHDEEKLKQCFEQLELISHPKLNDKNIESYNNVISNVEFNMYNGTQSVISYDRTIFGKADAVNSVLTKIRETRVWHHGPKGWQNVHFLRKPIE